MEKVNKILLELYNDRKQLLLLSLLGCISYFAQSIIPLDDSVVQATGLWIGIGGLVLTGASMIMGSRANRDAAEAQDEMNTITENAARENLQFQKEQQAKLDAQKDIYREMEFKNPYAENVYEDLTVNQQQAQFQAQQGAQQRANIMQAMRGAAGGSGIASLAQILANQGQLQAQQISASIGQQEAMNQRLRAQGEIQVQAGEERLQTMEMDRQATLLGMQMGASAGANTAAMQAQSNLISGMANEANMFGQQAAGYYNLAGQTLSTMGTAYAASQTPTPPKTPS